MNNPVHHLNHENHLVEEINNAVKKGDEYHKAAGAKLKQLKLLVQAKRPRIPWAKYLEENCSMRVRRANELICIAEGRSTVEKERAKTAERQARHKQKMKVGVTNAQSSFDELRSGYIDRAKTLSKAERIDEIHKLLDAFGLALHKDFIHTMTFRK